MKKMLLPLLLAALILAHGTASGWGFFGHRTITQIAVYELPTSMQGFYYRNMAELVRLCTAPDERRNDDPTEAPKHFIDMDHYSEDDPFGKVPRKYDEAVAKFTADTLKKYGTVPWVIMEMKDNLTEAFRQRDSVGIVKYSAELSHYASDIFVPLHTTMNYDGQLTDQKGLHSLWETQLPEKFIGEYKLDGESAKYVKDPLNEIWSTIQRSYGFLGETFDRAAKIDKTMKPEVRYVFSHKYGKTTRRYSDKYAEEYNKAVGGMVDYRLKGAPTFVASLWYSAWQDAGKPDLNALMHKKATKEIREQFATEMAAWKKGNLVQDQLLLAQQKVKKVEEVDQIKSAKDMAEPPVVDTEEAPAAPATSAPAAKPAPAPAKPAEKVKVKTKTPAGNEKSKQKAGTLDW